MSESTQPITPREIEDNLCDVFPEVVIQAFNELIKEHYRVQGKTTFTLNEVIKKIKKIDSSAKTDKLLEQGKLDIELLYEKYGWDVEFHSPDRDESFVSYFSFEKS